MTITIEVKHYVNDVYGPKEIAVTAMRDNDESDWTIVYPWAIVHEPADLSSYSIVRLIRSLLIDTLGSSVEPMKTTTTELPLPNEWLPYKDN